jgi:hypothetical protein
MLATNFAESLHAQVRVRGEWRRRGRFPRTVRCSACGCPREAPRSASLRGERNRGPGTRSRPEPRDNRATWDSSANCRRSGGCCVRSISSIRREAERPFQVLVCAQDVADAEVAARISAGRAASLGAGRPSDRRCGARVGIGGRRALRTPTIRPPRPWPPPARGADRGRRAHGHGDRRRQRTHGPDRTRRRVGARAAPGRRRRGTHVRHTGGGGGAPGPRVAGAPPPAAAAGGLRRDHRRDGARERRVRADHGAGRGGAVAGRAAEPGRHRGADQEPVVMATASRWRPASRRAARLLGGW